MPTRTSGSLSMVKNCRARGKLATGSMLSLWPESWIMYYLLVSNILSML